jgi:hypothetical protein
MMWALRAEQVDGGEFERSKSRACETPAETWGNSAVPWGQIAALQFSASLPWFLPANNPAQRL